MKVELTDAHCETAAEAESEAQGRSTASRRPRRDGKHSLGAAQRRPLARYARPIPGVRDVLAPTRRVGTGRSLALALAGVSERSRRGAATRLERGVHGRDLRSREKRGACIGKTRKDKGTKLMVLVWIGTCFAPIRISGRVGGASMTQRVGGRGRNPGERGVFGARRGPGSGLNGAQGTAGPAFLLPGL